MMDFLRWLWSEPPLMLIILGLLGICVQVARMAIQEDTKPDTTFAPGEVDQLARAIQGEAREVEKFVNGTLRSDVRNEYLKQFWAHHDHVIQNLRRARLGDTMGSLVAISQIEDRIADGIENGILVDDCNGINVPATVAGISRNYCDRVMRILGPHLRQETLKRVSAATGRKVDMRSGRPLRPDQQRGQSPQQQKEQRPSARDTLRPRK